MRFTVLLALFGLGLALRGSSSSSLSEQHFRVGREYRYRFDGRLSAGLPIPGEQSAVTRIQTIVRLQPENEQSMRLQLTETRFATSEENRVLSLENMKEVRTHEKFQKILSLPVRFSYRHGLVGEIEFHPSEQTWSANMKRAVLNMLQVNLIKKGINEKFDNDNEKDNDYFFANERTLEGECEVSYTKIRPLDKSGEQQLWTKSVNFEKCSMRPEVIYGRRYSEECKQCQQENEKMSSTVVSLNITGTPEKFLIHRVELDSKHVFAPIDEKQQLVIARVKNTLELIYSGEQEKEIEAVRSSEKKETLVYNAEHELDEEKFCQTGDEKYLRRLPNFQDQLDIIRSLLNRMAKQVDQGIELESTHNIARLVKVLRFASEDNLKELRRHISEKSELVQSLYWDSLALAGTKNTISELLEKINNKEITPLKASQLMKIIAEVRIPSEQIAREVFRFCESDVSSRNAVLRQSCWLSYGSIVHGICGQHKNVYGASTVQKNKCSRQTKEEFVRQLIEKMNQADTRFEKILFIKALANAGIDTSIVELEKIIRDKSVQKIVRMQAVDALRRLRQVMPKKIQKVLLPVYGDSWETPEMRMLALNMIMQTQPQAPIIDTIARQMENERSKQVRVYTYSTLKTFAKSENPAEAEFSQRVSQVLSSLPEEKINYLESKHKAATWYSRQAGATLNWAALFSNDSVLPKEIVASLDAVMGGEWNKYLAQLGLVQHNLDAVLTKIFEKVDESGLEQLVVRGKRSSSFFHPGDLLRSLIETLRINHRQVSKDEPHAMLYIRYKDMDYAFLPIDLDTIPEIIRRVVRDGQLDISEIEKTLTQTGRFSVGGAAFFHETLRKIPSALGLPLVMTTKLPTVAHTQGTIKFDLEPKDSDRFTGLRLHVQAKNQLASTHISRLELLTPVGSVGVKLLQGGRIHLPIDGEIQINWEKKLVIKTVIKSPEQKRHVVHLMSRPVVFIREWHNEQRHYPEPREVTVELRQDKYPIHYFDRQYFEQTGIRMIVSGHYRRPFELMTALSGENVLDIVIEPTEESPKEIVSQMDVSVFEPIEIEEPRLLKQFYEKSSEHFETEYDVEFEKHGETERRSQFQEQLRQVKNTKGNKHRVHMKIHTVGGVRTQEADFELRGLCDEQLRFCRVHMDILRSPMEGESRKWQLKSVAEWIYPQMPSSMKKMLEQPHREWTCICETKWGAEKQNEVVVRIQGEQSREQKVWMKKADRQQNILSQEQKLEEASKLNQYKIQVEHELSSETSQWIQNYYNLFKSYNYFTLQTIPQEKRNSPVLATVSIEPVTRQVYNLTVETPKEILRLHNVQMPFQLPVTNIRRSFGPVKSVRHVVKVVEHQTRAECVVKSKEVQTFDEVFYRTPITSCYSVLAKDCSQNPKFAVLMKKVDTAGEEKMLKVITNENEIVLERTKEEIVVRVNGKQVNEEEMEKYGITKRGEENYHVDTNDVTVQFDGYYVKIRVSALYKNKQCGLCGHYDGEQIDEFRRADNEVTEDLEEFSRSYQSKDQECKVDEQEMSKKRNYKVLREETSSSEEEMYENENQEPVLRNRVVERGELVCFSEKPVKTCPPKTQEGKADKKTVSFKCINRSKSLAQTLIRLARKEIISDRLEELTKTIEKEIRIPHTCSVY